MKARSLDHRADAPALRFLSPSFWRPEPTEAAAGRTARSDWGLGATGLALIGLCAAAALLSPQFDYEKELTQKPTLALVGLLMAAGALYLFGVATLVRSPGGRGRMAWVVGVGVVLRLLFIGSTPMLEDDFHRYLWDGAVAAHGFNPYAYAPKEFAQSAAERGAGPARLRQLAEESWPIVARVNHAEMRSTYPPVAQLAFALAYRIRPWSVVVWRLTLLGFDVTVLALLIGVLRAVRLPALLAGVYWWNPLLVKEIFNSGHMDVITLAFVMGAILLAVRGRHVWAAGALALAVGAKLWPLVLAPLILRPTLPRPRRLALGVGVFAVLTGLFLWPIYAGGLDSGCGLRMYAKSWQNNDALFRSLVAIIGVVLERAGSHAWHSQFVTRVVVCALLGLWIGAMVRRPIRDGIDLCDRALWIVAGLFLLSPTQFPWYYLWLLPLLAIRPRLSLLTFTILLPLYYTRHFLEPRGGLPVFENGVVWVEHAPVWALLIGEWLARRSQRPGRKGMGTED